VFGKLSTLAMAGAASLTAFGASAQTLQRQYQPGVTPPGAQPGPSGMTQTCAYNTGPRAGQTVNYAGTPGAASVLVGSRCADMQGSSGQAITPEIGRGGQGRFYASPGAPNAWSSSGGLRRGFTRTCSFTSGPRAGTTVDYSYTLGAQPVSIGSACSDGASRGSAVAAGR
jgi:hypothetical protein